MVNIDQEQNFINDIVRPCLLERTLIWIRDNLLPQDVFTKVQLKKWAEDNGYVNLYRGMK